MGPNGGVAAHERRRKASRVKAGTNNVDRCGGEVLWEGLAVDRERIGR